MDDIFHIYFVLWVIKTTLPTLLLHPTRSSLWVWSQYIPCSPLLSSLSPVAFTCHFNYSLASSCVSYTRGYCLPSPGNTSLICFKVQMKKKKKQIEDWQKGPRERSEGGRDYGHFLKTHMWARVGTRETRDGMWEDTSMRQNTRLFNISMSNFFTLPWSLPHFICSYSTVRALYFIPLYVRLSCCLPLYCCQSALFFHISQCLAFIHAGIDFYVLGS